MTVEGRRIDDLDTKRTAALTLFGGLYSGGALHVLYGMFPRAASEIGRISGVRRDFGERPREPWGARASFGFVHLHDTRGISKTLRQ